MLQACRARLTSGAGWSVALPCMHATFVAKYGPAGQSLWLLAKASVPQHATSQPAGIPGEMIAFQLVILQGLIHPCTVAAGMTWWQPRLPPGSDARLVSARWAGTTGCLLLPLWLLWAEGGGGRKREAEEDAERQKEQLTMWLQQLGHALASLGK